LETGKRAEAGDYEMSEFESGPIAIDMTYDWIKNVYRFRLSDGTCKEVCREVMQDWPAYSKFAAKLEKLG
jgi:hypothetical protein